MKQTATSFQLGQLVKELRRLEYASFKRYESLNLPEHSRQGYLAKFRAYRIAREEAQLTARVLLAPICNASFRGPGDGCAHANYVTTADGNGAYCKDCGETVA